MFPTHFGPVDPPEAEAGSAPAPTADKRAHPSSSDEDDTKPLHRSKLRRESQSGMAKTLRSRVAGSASDVRSAMLPGPFTLGERVSTEDDPPVYQVAHPAMPYPLVAKPRRQTPGSSPDSSGSQPDEIDHPWQIFQRIGEHPNINTIHGPAELEVNGVKADALIMNAGDRTLLAAIDDFTQARHEGRLTDKTYLGVVLPAMARALQAGAAHCASAQVAHRDIDLANILLFEDGRPLQLIDFGRSEIEKSPSEALWPQAEVAANNMFTSIYPADCSKIAMILRHLATLMDGGAAFKAAPHPSTPELNALQALLTRMDPRVPAPNGSASDFDFLKLGSDEEAGKVVAAVLGGGSGA